MHETAKIGPDLRFDKLIHQWKSLSSKMTVLFRTKLGNKSGFSCLGLKFVH